MNSFVAFFQLPFLQMGLCGVLCVSLLGGLLSPLIVLKQRAYLCDSLSHFVVPGVALGFLAASLWQGANPWLLAIMGALAMGLLGTVATEFSLHKERIPQDAAAVAHVSAFFALGVLIVVMQERVKVSLEHILFGDVLSLSWMQVLILAFLCLTVAFCLVKWRLHWNAWLVDPEWAVLMGYQIRRLDRLFPLLLATSVLVCLLAVGSLMVCAVFTLPALVARASGALHGKTIIYSVFFGLLGFFIALSLDAPVGPTLVLVHYAAWMIRQLGSSTRPAAPNRVAPN